MYIKIILFAFFILTLPSSSGSTIIYNYGPFVGKVIDAETNEPIEGAVVLAEYTSTEYTIAGSGDNYLNAQETVTDERGEYRIPRLVGVTFRPFQSHGSTASFTVFKPNYRVFSLSTLKDGVLVDGKTPSNTMLPPKQYVVIELPRLTNEQEREKNLMFGARVNYNIPYNKQKRLLEAINNELLNLGINQRIENKRNRPYRIKTLEKTK